MRKSISMGPLLYGLLTPAMLLNLTTSIQTANAQENSVPLSTITIESLLDISNDNSGLKEEEEAQSKAAPTIVVTRKEIDEAGITTIEEAVKQTPNFNFSNIGSPRITFQTVRGIGNSFSTNYFNQPIGIYVDGVPISGAEFNRSISDAKSVEVIRGPLGALSGHNAIAGSIHITSRTPTTKPEAEVTGKFGDNGQVGGSVYLSGPINEKTLTGRAFFEYTERDGFTDYLSSGDTVDGLQSYFGSGSLLFAPNSKLLATLSASIEKHDEGGYAYQPYNTFKNRVVDFLPPNGDDRDAHSVTSNVRYNWGAIELMSLSSYRHYDMISNQNLDYNPLNGGGTYFADEEGTQYSQELRLTGKIGNNISWFAGAQYLTEQHKYDYDYNVPAFMFRSLVSSEYDRKELAGYGELTWKSLSGLELTAGLRAVNDRHEFKSNVAGNAKEDFNLLTPNFRVAYRFDQDRVAYISAIRGARAGGFDRITNDNTPYDTEYLWSYEAGLKSQWFNKSLTLNAALFYIDWTDQQVKEQVLAGLVRTTNAAESHSQGLEIDASWRPIAGLELAGFIGITQGEYDKFIDANTGADYSGNRLAATPKFTGGASLQYRWQLMNLPLKAVARVDYKYTGDQYFDFENRLKQKGYGVVNTRLGVEHEKYSATFYVKNLFDEDYRSFGFFDGSADVAVAAPSRLIGLEVKAKF
ncbi:MAG: TonB-dependent receptor [Rhizobiales bacterium]|nr:TonB-dependent receptor [Hyphomicrobiales bacterium]